VLQAEKIVMSHAQGQVAVMGRFFKHHQQRKKKNFESKKKKEEKGACLFVGPTSRGRRRSASRADTTSRAAGGTARAASGTVLVATSTVRGRLEGT